jgi:type II secretory ATPase GspE/PulE/Tfp pilus assembly ATPase PilB-like protein
LLTGPTGSGKSTTLYVAIEQLLETHGGNVITIEDPVEYEIRGASQVEVDSADKVNFSKALRSVLRHDPDVVMIGEIRDAETASIAVKASLTGHLVFSTLHTNTATGVVTRLLDLGIEPFLIAATLRLSVAQRLVRRLCPHCRRERPMLETEALSLRQPKLTGHPVYEPVGCIACAGRGYTGRIGLFEILESSESFANLISSGATEDALNDHLRQRGESLLLDDGLEKILDGRTTVKEVVSAVTTW